MNIQWSALLLFYARVIAVITAGLLLLNGIVMVVAPGMWFKLPEWIRSSLSPTAKAFTGWGGERGLRIYGTVVAGFALVVVLCFFPGLFWGR